jgi:hypothetical protein
MAVATLHLHVKVGRTSGAAHCEFTDNGLHAIAERARATHAPTTCVITSDRRVVLLTAPEEDLNASMCRVDVHCNIITRTPQHCQLQCTKCSNVHAMY